MRYEPQMPSDISIPANRSKGEQFPHSRAEWTEEGARLLHGRSAGRARPQYPYCHRVDNGVRGVPAGFDREMELVRCPDGVPTRHEPGSIGVAIIPRNDLEEALIQCLGEALFKKFPKLSQCKALAARTLLVLEGVDLPSVHQEYVHNHRPALLAARKSRLDEIYGVERLVDFMWWGCPMKRDGLRWPTAGMALGVGPCFEPGRWPTRVYPNGIVACVRRQRSEGFLPGCIFKEDELDGPTLT